MLVFSTMLPVTAEFTVDALINTALDWISSFAQSDFRLNNISWNGEHRACFDEGSKRIKFDEYADKHIAYVRYERTDDKGIIWAIDYVLNTMDKKLVIALNRDYAPDALTTHTYFYAPEYVKLLIMNGYLETDGRLSISDSIHLLSAEDLGSVVSREAGCSMPVVFVSRKDGMLNEDISCTLANRLRGIAHVVSLEENASEFDIIETNGDIGVYYPSSVMNHQLFSEAEENLVDNVVTNVMQYCASQTIPEMYTVLGIEQAMLFDDLANEALNAANESALRELKDRIAQLSSENMALSTALIARGNAEAILYRDIDRDLVSYEVRGLVLIALKNALDSGKLGIRSKQVITNILQNTENSRIVNERNAYEKKITAALLNSRTKKALEAELLRLGFEIARDDKHIIIRYGGDPNYQFTLSSTPSDIRAGENAAKEILRSIR